MPSPDKENTIGSYGDPVVLSARDSDAGVRLDEFLLSRFPDHTGGQIRAWIGSGSVRVQNQVRTAGWRLRNGDRVDFDVAALGTGRCRPESIPFTVLWEDDQMLVIEKPSGIPVHPAGQHQSGTVWNGLLHRFREEGREGRPGLPHRLDRETSGLLLVALTRVALSRLTISFQRGEVQKRYLAVVEQAPPGARETTGEVWEWDTPIGRRDDRRPVWGPDPAGRPALTRGRVLRRSESRSLLELRPVTGRTNQLRIHAASAGMPLVGDRLFGGPPYVRLCLHAAGLEIPHPTRDRMLRFESEPDESFLAALEPVSR